ncbi:MAG: serine/threonine-protein kinase [Leptolyngbyaceae bacterium]|nr:serine/threonine-protein kinase [Leptolyngbyaceae bacterium]
MSYCLNPDCQRPSQNLPKAKYCQGCGEELLLKERYRPLNVIGQGGFGKTFLAIDEHIPSQPRCVIKQLVLQGHSAQISRKAIELFEQEAVRLEQLGKHPQIPELYGHLEQKGKLYIIQEFIEGQTLAEEVQQQGAFTEHQIRSLLNHLLPVLQFIHQGQIIHRDIKPENIIRRKSDHRLVLVDFGAAKEVTQTALVKTGTSIGSVGYLAPEQAHGKAVFASDFFSLGATCISLLTQTEPCNLYDPLENRFVWKQKIIKPVGNELIQILDRMTHCLVKQRYQSASEVLQALNPQELRTSTSLTTVSVASKLQTSPIPPRAPTLWITAGVVTFSFLGAGLLGWQQLYSNPLSSPTAIDKNDPELQAQPRLDTTSVPPTPSPQPPSPSLPKPVNSNSDILLPAPNEQIPPASTYSETAPLRRVTPITVSPNILRQVQNSIRQRVLAPSTQPIEPSSNPSLETTIESDDVAEISNQTQLNNQQNSSAQPQTDLQPWEITDVEDPPEEIEDAIGSNQP